MRKLLFILALGLLVTSAYAGGYKTHRMRDGSVLCFERHEVVMPIGSVPAEPWDAAKVYRVPVILFSFADCDFSCENPKVFYDRMFNEHGYNLGGGPGCVADYFRDQSRGLFNVQFDIIGPVKLTSQQKLSGGGYNDGRPQMNEAVQAVNSQVDFSEYDWYGDGKVPAVLFIYAGYGGNELKSIVAGCIHPNTGGLNKTVDGVRLQIFSISNEMWSNNECCGIGTICHEYCHTFGLPDFYPTSGDEFSVLDEWDLMDGGCYAGDGWFPVNLSIHERELLKWQSPVDLTVSTDITDMPSFNESGVAYRIVNEAYPSEYYLLENRQQIGWDFMLPGHGLLISHVDYLKSAWSSVIVNNNPNHHRFDYIHADGLGFNYYQSIYGTANRRDEYGRSIRLKGSAYPYTDAEGVVHDALTDNTSPAASLFHANSDGSLFMGKPITQIRENDGLISFHFSDTPDAIVPLSTETVPVAVYDLRGHALPLGNTLSPGIYIIKYADGTTKKVFR